MARERWCGDIASPSATGQSWNVWKQPVEMYLVPSTATISLLEAKVTCYAHVGSVRLRELFPGAQVGEPLVWDPLAPLIVRLVFVSTPTTITRFLLWFSLGKSIILLFHLLLIMSSICVIFQVQPPPRSSPVDGAWMHLFRCQGIMPPPRQCRYRWC